MVPPSYVDSLLDAVSHLPGYNPGATIRFRFMTPAEFSPADYSARHPGASADKVATRAAEQAAYLTGFREFADEQKDATRQIFKFIESVCNLKFVEASQGDPGPMIRFGRTAMADSGVNMAVYGTTATGSPHRPVNDVLISTSRPDEAPVGSFNYSLLLHEILHALGLKHPHDVRQGRLTITELTDDVTTAVTQMSYSDSAAFPADSFGTTPLLLDIGALQSLYGARAAALADNAFTNFAGNTTYTFAYQTPNAQSALTTIGRGQIKAIWEPGGQQGGIDTFDASSYQTAVDIRLVAGELSSIGGTVNIAIAYGSEIENAKGGSARDILIGNHLANRLEGNAERDLLDGGTAVGQAWDDGVQDTLVGGGGADTYILHAAASGQSTADVILDHGQGKLLVQRANGSYDSLNNLQQSKGPGSNYTGGELICAHMPSSPCWP